MRHVPVVVVASIMSLTGAVAQTAVPVDPATAAHAQAPSASSAAMTVAPVAPGSTQMHMVPTPQASARTTSSGGNTNGGAN